MQIEIALLDSLQRADLHAAVQMEIPLLATYKTLVQDPHFHQGPSQVVTS